MTYSVKRGGKAGTGELHTEMEAKHVVGGGGGGDAEEGAGGKVPPTPVNLTNHAYWNLSGGRKRSVRGHGLAMRCDRYLPLDGDQVRCGGAGPARWAACIFAWDQAIVLRECPVVPTRLMHLLAGTTNMLGGREVCFSSVQYTQASSAGREYGVLQILPPTQGRRGVCLGRAYPDPFLSETETETEIETETRVLASPSLSCFGGARRPLRFAAFSMARCACALCVHLQGAAGDTFSVR